MNENVAYWMNRDQRVNDNRAMLFAYEKAQERGVRLFVFFNVVPEYHQASKRQYDFMMKGLGDVEQDLASENIDFILTTGLAGKNIPDLVEKHRIGQLVTDFSPLKHHRQWLSTVKEKITAETSVIDAHNIVPCLEASDKQEFAARTLRPKIMNRLHDHLKEPPPIVKKPVMNNAVGVMNGFIAERLDRYAAERNDPTKDALSNLSPYLHFGRISSRRVVEEVLKSGAGQASKDAFIEEITVRKELSDNFCYYNRDYDNFEGFPDWAKLTLNRHRSDKREYIYSIEELEPGNTHDDLWNAAQLEMVKKGKMHGYMRMYWVKKILEWSPSPEKAIEAAIYLNDKYELDGQDPNGYTGIAWGIGGVHDRAWKERPVFGKIRYMSYNGAKSKFDVGKYIADNMPRQVKTRKGKANPRNIADQDV